MAYKASPERAEILSLLARLVVVGGAIVAIWLIAPTKAEALEPSTDLDDPVSDTVTDAADSVETTVTEVVEEPIDAVTDDAADSAATTVTDAAEEPIDAVTDTADSAATTVTDAAEEPIDPGTVLADVNGHVATATDVSSATRDLAGSDRDAIATAVDLADDALSTVETARDGAAVVAHRLQESVSPLDMDVMPAVEATAGAVTEPAATAPRIQVDSGMGNFGEGDVVTGLRFGGEPAFTSRGPPVTTGPVAAAATFDSEALPRSPDAPGAPSRSDGLPAAAQSTSRQLLDAWSFDDFAAVLAAIMLALGFAQWSRREAERHHRPIFLPLAERPG
jgi:hypothetical protein